MAGHHARWERSFREIRPRASLRYPLPSSPHTRTHACETFHSSSIGWTAEKKLGGFFAIYPGKRTGSTVCSMGLNLTRNNLTTYYLEASFTGSVGDKRISFYRSSVTRKFLQNIIYISLNHSRSIVLIWLCCSTRWSMQKLKPHRINYYHQFLKLQLRLQFDRTIWFVQE